MFEHVLSARVLRSVKMALGVLWVGTSSPEKTWSELGVH